MDKLAGRGHKGDIASFHKSRTSDERPYKVANAGRRTVRLGKANNLLNRPVSGVQFAKSQIPSNAFIGTDETSTAYIQLYKKQTLETGTD